TGLGSQRPPDVYPDRALDELHAAVGKPHVATARMEAGGIFILAVTDLAPRAAVRPATRPWDSRRVGRNDRVEESVARRLRGPTPAFVLGRGKILLGGPHLRTLLNA